MYEKAILLHLLLAASTIICSDEDICDEDVIRSIEQKQICERNYYGYSECHYGYPVIKKTITCAYTTVNHFISYNLTRDTKIYYPITLKITNSDIAVWPTSSFRNKEYLTSLYLEDLKIQKLMPGVFNFLNDLKELYLAGNELTIISDGIFNTLVSLEKLDLSRNQIQNITDHAFAGIKLNGLLLNNNNISRIGQELVDSLTNLVTLDASNNNLKEIENINNLPLHELYLNNNVIEYVDFELLQYVQTTIDLSFNNISVLKNFNLSTASRILLSHNKIKKLEENMNILHLDLTHNELDTIDSNLLSSKLKQFYAGDNFISIVSVDAFDSLNELEYLVLKNNNLSSIPNSCFRDLRSLVFLDLSGNNITYFTFGTFDNLISLEKLDISDNKLTDLQQYTLHSLSNLKFLYFENNEISDVNVDDMLLHMQHLRQVNLDGNIWFCKKLVTIVHKLKNRGVSISTGKSLEENNIYGIKCYETSERPGIEGTNLDNSKLSNFFNEDFTKTVMYKYFNKDFRGSNFFKYLENLKNIVNDSYTEKLNAKHFELLINAINSKPNNSFSNNFTATAMYNYFNKDSKNSEFFKYLEELKRQATNQNSSENKTGNKLEQLIKLFKEVIENDSNNFSKDFSKSDMYNYFNKDFKNSSFFKYLESLNKQINEEKNSESFNDGKMGKLISTFEAEKLTSYRPDYTGLLSFISVMLVIIICIMSISTYANIFHIKKYSVSKKEEVELI